MTDDIPEGQAKPGLTFSENKNLILVGIVAAVVIIAVIAIVFAQLPSDTGNKQPPAIQTTPPEDRSISVGHSQTLKHNPSDKYPDDRANAHDTGNTCIAGRFRPPVGNPFKLRINLPADGRIDYQYRLCNRPYGMH